MTLVHFLHHPDIDNKSMDFDVHALVCIWFVALSFLYH